ncbi:MAG TPA: hypothetical protein VNE21_06130, partial [Mycobacteriales bacterium]|nr:hypothetical protein [Mycobacteriales bacterium]
MGRPIAIRDTGREESPLPLRDDRAVATKRTSRASREAISKNGLDAGISGVHLAERCSGLPPHVDAGTALSVSAGNRHRLPAREIPPPFPADRPEWRHLFGSTGTVLISKDRVRAHLALRTASPVAADPGSAQLAIKVPMCQVGGAL